jgi:2-polyprenyl-6-methoxyphenol hydroxylase-like FAD-dependent oxidoreductase
MTSDSVLIVGAGPTGLTLANVLARYGVPVRIVEKKPELSRHTKATNLMQRTQELLFALGLLDPLDELSGHMRRLMVHAYGRCFGPRTMHLKESPFPDVLLCGQHNFEAVAAQGLSNAGVEVEFSTELTGLSQDDEGCSATLTRGGHQTTSRFRYVVGCDGYAGVTRTFTKLNFQTYKTGVGIRQADCKLTWRRLSGMEQMWLFYFNQGFAVVVPLPGGIHRVLTIEPKSAFPQREPQLGEIQAKLREVADDPSLTLTDPEWFSYTDLAMGHAPALRDGRILLAGDSGNPVLPNGGQGMNTGIADAFNLGWKLTAVLRHTGSQELLDTYNQERHALRLALEKTQFNSLKYTTLVTPKVMRAAFRLFAEPLLNYGGEYKMAQAFSELTIHTRESPLTLNAVRGEGLRAGDRALDAGVADGFTPLRLYDLIYRGAWTLLAFTGRGSTANPTAVQQTLSSLAPFPNSFIVSTTSHIDTGKHILYDLDEEAHRVYGVTRPTIFLIRPDGHIGAKVLPTQIKQLTAYMDRWVPEPSQSFTRSITIRIPPVPVSI